MSTFAKKVTSAVAGLAVVFSIVAPIAGVSAAYSSLDAANKLATLGVIVDNSANPSAYRLADTTSREELSKIIANLGGLTVTEGESVYSDRDFADWSEKYAKALNEAGYAASNEFFNPKNNATKIEALKWVMEARGIATGSGDNWMEARVNGAVEAGIATAFTDYNADASRGQVFIWAAEAIDVEDEVVVDDNLLCSILGTCEDDEPTTPSEPTEPTTPVVPSGDDMLEVSLSPLSPTSGMVAAGKDRTPFVAFDVTAGDADVTLKDITLSYVGLSDSGDFDNLAVYRGNDKVSKQDSKGFNNDEEAELTFENDTVVQAGQTVTFMVTGLVANSTTNSAHQIAVTEVGADATVTLGSVKSVVFNTVLASNTATIYVDEDEESTTPTVGEETTLADFSLEEKDDNEDVILKSLTFEFGGSADAEDDIADIVLMAEGEVIASDLMVNSDDEIVVDVDYVVAADDKVDFELVAVITGSIGETLTLELTEVYAIGADTGIIATVKESSTVTFDGVSVADFSDIEGAEINVSWDKSSTDEAKPGAEDVQIGTLTLSTDGDYTITSIEVEVVSNGAGPEDVEDVLANLELDGRSADDESNTATTTATYTFEDITLRNEEISLDLVAELVDDVTLNGENLEFTVVITGIEDEENDETYGSTTVGSILSTNSFKTKEIKVESASMTLTQSRVSDRDLVLGNGIEVVLYEGKINVGDASEVTLTDVVLAGTLSATTYEAEDIIDSATLNIGGVTADADINGNDIEFNNADITIAAGAKNVEVLVTAILKDDDAVTNGDTFAFDIASAAAISAEDEDGEDVLSASVTVNQAANTVVTMNENGTLTIDIVNGGDFEDDVEEVVLAGSSNVVLAEVEFEAEEEDIYVNELVFVIPADGSTTFADTLENVRLMAGSTVIADGGVVTLNGTDTEILFEDFVLEDTGAEVSATLVADLNIITTEGGVVSAAAGDIVVSIDSIDAEGDASNEDITGAYLTLGTTSSEAVAVVPVLMTLAVDSTLSTSSSEASVEIILDYGDNELDNNDVTVTGITFAGVVAGDLQIRNDDEATVATITDAASATFSDEVNNGDIYTFKVDTSITADPEVRIAVNGFTYTVNGSTYTSLNDKIINLGTYDND